MAFAALAQDEDDLKRPGEAARLVANNIHIMRTAVAEMAGVGALTVKQLVGLQEDLVLDHRAHGLRRTQNWVGGSPYHPLGAAFVPPPPEIVQPLLEDLAAYLNDVSSPHWSKRVWPMPSSRRFTPSLMAMAELVVR